MNQLVIFTMDDIMENCDKVNVHTGKGMYTGAVYTGAVGVVYTDTEDDYFIIDSEKGMHSFTVSNIKKIEIRPDEEVVNILVSN